jgi:hypothetical protein
MGANDSPTTTRSIIADYFDWRLNNRITTTNNRLFLIVRKIASDCETAYCTQQPTFNSDFSSLTIDLQTLNNIRNIHNEIARELFNDGGITWTRIITFISFSAMLAKHILQQQSNNLSSDLIISSVVDWTANFIDTDLRAWLESQNYWVKNTIDLSKNKIILVFIYLLKAGCLKIYDKTPQRRNSIGRYASIFGTIG